MTRPDEKSEFDFGTMQVDDVPHTVPDHTAGAGESRVDRPEPKRRPGIFGTASTKDRTGPRNVKSPKERKFVANKPGQFVDRLEELYMGIAFFAMPFDAEIGAYLMMPSPDITDATTGAVQKGQTGARRCAIAWDEAAQRNESVRRFLDSLLAASVWGALVMAHMPILFALAKNHTPLGEKFDPASAMEAMLRKQQQTSE